MIAFSNRRLVTVFVILLILIVCMCGCSNKGEQVSSTEFEYEIVDGFAVLTKYVGSETKVVVPAEIDGYKVSATANTFENNTLIKEIIFSEGIEHIGEATCNRCLNLKTISIPISVVDLGSYAFADTGISSIVLPEKTVSIGEECFARCRNLKSVVSKAEKLSIADGAFYDSNSLIVMQVKSRPDYGRNTFSSNVEFTHSNIATFFAGVKELFSSSTTARFSKWFNQQSGFLQMLMKIVIIWLILLVGASFCMTLKIPGFILRKRRKVMYNKYCRAYGEDVGPNDIAFFRYKRLSFQSDRILHSIVIVSIISLLGSLIAFTMTELEKYNFVHCLLSFSVIVLFVCILIPIAAALLTYAFPIIKSKLFKNSFGRGHRVRGRVRKVSKRDLYYDQ